MAMTTEKQVKKISILANTVSSIIAALLYSYTYLWFNSKFPEYNPSLFGAKDFILFSTLLLIFFIGIATASQDFREILRLHNYLIIPVTAFFSSILIWAFWPKILKTRAVGKEFSILFLNAAGIGMAIPITFLIGIPFLVARVIFTRMI